MKILLTTLVISLSLFAVSCNPNKFNEEQISNLILNKDKGILAGIDIGDDWETLKQNAPNDWTIVDTLIKEGGYDSEHYQLLIPRENDSHRMAFTFKLDDSKHIRRIDFYLNAEEGEEAKIEKFYSNITKEFNDKFISNEFGKWIYESPNGKKYTILILIDVTEQFDPSVSFLTIE